MTAANPARTALEPRPIRADRRAGRAEWRVCATGLGVVLGFAGGVRRICAIVAVDNLGDRAAAVGPAGFTGCPERRKFLSPFLSCAA